LAILLLAAGFLAAPASVRRDEPPPSAVAARERSSVVAMARLEPGSKFVGVGSLGPDVVARLLVKEGDVVEAGRELAYLRSYETRRLEAETARVRMAQARLKALEVDGERAKLRGQEVQVEHAQREVERLKGLLERGLVSGQEQEAADYQARSAAELLKQAQAALSASAQAAELAIREADGSLRLAQTQLEQAVVRAPIGGRVLRVGAQAGEGVSGPFIELGATDHMYAVAEVHATDVGLVAVGQHVVYSSPSLPAPLEGAVEAIGNMIFYPGIFGEDPSRPINSKVFQVRIRLEPDARAARFSNLEGEVRIDVGAPKS
jgi:HlyD family secretion protein